jgi:hypothetical protein
MLHNHSVEIVHKRHQTQGGSPPQSRNRCLPTPVHRLSFFFTHQHPGSASSVPSQHCAPSLPINLPESEPLVVPLLHQVSQAMNE